MTLLKDIQKDRAKKITFVERQRNRETKTDIQIDMDIKSYRQRERKKRMKNFKDTLVIKESSTVQSFFKFVSLVLENLKPI
jgi:hypothetical protein